GQNIRGGARYLRQQLDRFGDLTLALAAHRRNAPPRRGRRCTPPAPASDRRSGRVAGGGNAPRPGCSAPGPTGR
ncbi:MAG: hypothetical protein R6V07_05785, partial [Armatimonadota bacterium]